MLEGLFRRYPLLRKAYLGLLREGFSRFSTSSDVRVVEKEWKNLIILDACRFDDILQHKNMIEGKLTKIESLGSNTPEWIEKNFSNDCSDIVCIAGNPYYSKEKILKIVGKNPFHHIEDVWDYGWDEELGTVPPNEITQAALEMEEKFPEKRMLIHYMQPHFPFLTRPDITERAHPLWEDPNKRSGLKNNIILRISSMFPKLKGLWKHSSAWNLIKEGEIGINEFKKLHHENLKIVLKEAKELANEMEGKSVISSDHGEMFGEFWVYGHPRGIRFSQLIEVPWIEVGKLESQ